MSRAPDSLRSKNHKNRQPDKMYVPFYLFTHANYIVEGLGFNITDRAEPPKP